MVFGINWFIHSQQCVRRTQFPSSTSATDKAIALKLRMQTNFLVLFLMVILDFFGRSTYKEFEVIFMPIMPYYIFAFEDIAALFQNYTIDILTRNFDHFKKSEVFGIGLLVRAKQSHWSAHECNCLHSNHWVRGIYRTSQSNPVPSLICIIAGCAKKKGVRAPTARVI